MNINSDTLTGLIYPVLLWLLGKMFAAIAGYFKSRMKTFDDMQKTLGQIRDAQLKMESTIYSYDEKISEIPRLKKGMAILFSRVGLNGSVKLDDDPSA